jgi:HEAT repeat protein
LLLLQAAHENCEIRLTVAQALAALSEDPRCVDALIRLTTDSSSAVRDWATFGLASLTEDDSPKVRNALSDRLGDPDAAVRGEALVGLAIRQDERVVEPLLAALEEADREQGHDFAREALQELHDIERYPALLKWKRNA